MSLPFDPFEYVRRRFANELARQERRIVDAVLSVPGAAAERVAGKATQLLNETLDLLGRLSHGAADAIVEASRGPYARALTPRETALVAEAYGDRVPASRVRIVPGPGYSKIAFAAFLNGNPAITLGNTIFLKPGVVWIRPAELPQTMGGVRLLVHEWTHVIQYATLGYAAFGRRYADELASHGGNADRLYDYRTRNLPFNGETLEGQAEMVGDLAGASRGKTPADAVRVQQLRAKLRGTGIYGQ
jgi:hypothetical protein